MKAEGEKIGFKMEEEGKIGLKIKKEEKFGSKIKEEKNWLKIKRGADGKQRRELLTKKKVERVEESERPGEGRRPENKPRKKGPRAEKRK